MCQDKGRRESRPIVETIASVAEQHATDTALVAADGTLTYRELVELANGIMQMLNDAGAERPSRIGIVTSDSTRTYAAILAIVASGNAYVPINPDNPLNRTEKVIRQAGIHYVIADSTAPGSAGQQLDMLAVTVIGTDAAEPIPGRLRLADTEPADLAYLFFTSGSTGEPKGVPIQHAQLSAFTETIVHDCGYNFSAEDRFLQMFSLTFDLSVMCIFAPWFVGAACCVVPVSGLGALNVLDVLEKQRITVALMVPSVLSYVSRFLPELSFPDLRLSLFCGEALTHSLVSEWSGSVPNARIENVYGPTEATIFCTRYIWTESESEKQSFNGVVPIGSAMPGMSTHIISDGTDVPGPRERGELCLSGQQLMAAYWNNPDATAKAFTQTDDDGHQLSLYRTGDIAYQDDQGDLVYCGRLDSQVKIDGHRIELGEIEHHARAHIGHALAAVTLSASKDGHTSMVLHVQHGDFTRESLEEHLTASLPSYMQPRQVRIVERLPLNKSGKIDRPTLRDTV